MRKYEFQKEMDKVEVNSYKDCTWYVEDADKCKLPSYVSNMSKCICKEKLEDICIWITKFLESTPEDIEDTEKYVNLVPLLNEVDVMMDSVLSDEKNSSNYFNKILDALGL